MVPLVDTNVLSELARVRPNAGVVEWASRVERIALSVVTVEEIECGLAWRPNERLEAWFATFLEACAVLDVTAPVARLAGRLRGDLRRRGLVRTQADLLIAATALIHGLPLVTRNERDFAGLGVAVLNPFR